jgi:Fe-S-cluster containining protein
LGDSDEPPDDCTRCAACCFSESPRHARVTGDDYARLGEDAERLVTWLENEAFMRLVPIVSATVASTPVPAGPRRCAALQLHPARGGFSCSVYEQRPEVCRELERGSGGCRGEIAAKGDRPKRALTLLAARLPPRAARVR